MSDVLLTCIIIFYGIPVVVNLIYAVWEIFNFKGRLSPFVIAFIPLYNLVMAVCIIGGWILIAAFIDDVTKKGPRT